MPISAKKPFYVGADGCKLGWFAVAISDEGQWETKVFLNILSLWDRYRDASLILVDIPIGLNENGTVERRCDIEARKVLGPPRASSVFPAPCRQAVYAATYEEASATNEQITGRRLSRQIWGIIPKILEMDSFLLKEGSARAYIKEIHPELCFWGLKGRPMQHSKRSAEGYAERFRVLQSYLFFIDAIVSKTLNNYRRNDVKKDDILDALVAAITAFPGLNALNSLPEPPELDGRGIPMQMLFRPLIAGKPLV